MVCRDKDMLVSVIMPVFNAKEYLPKAIESILGQSYKNIELVIVDDGSSDGSGSVCDSYAEKDIRVKVIHQENHGLCHARNKGLEMTRGGKNYIAFADHDDIYLDGSIEKLVEIARDSSIDLIKGTYVGEILDADGSVRDYEAKMQNALLNLNELTSNYKLFNYSVRAMWNGIYKAEIIHSNNIRFDESLKAGAEDYSFNLEYLKYVEKIGLTEYPLYMHYARANQSASVGYNENRQKGIVKDYHKESRLLKSLKISDESYINHQLWYFYMLVREYCFKDTPISKKEIANRLKLFTSEMDNFKLVRFKDKVLLYKRMPKSMIKWGLLHHGCEGVLFDQYVRKQG